jgi:alkanesulfonate monooxygenase SsuD/methylene tetrahydromethanopterin reductase-like flavin-dependent oxidoreductase (luciferase family)
MTGCVVGSDEADLHRRAEAVLDVRGRSGSPRVWLESVASEWVVGTVEQAVERLRGLERMGVQRVMLQHLAHGDTEMITLLGEEVAPAAR